MRIGTIHRNRESNQIAKLFKSHHHHSISIGRYQNQTPAMLCFLDIFYGMESWTLTETTERRLGAFDTWLYRKILRISGVDIVINKAVIERIKKNLSIMNTNNRRKLDCLGHITRNESKYRLLKCVLQRKTYGRRATGRTII